MAEQDKANPQSWWQTLPGIITALAALITALSGLLVSIHQFGGAPAPNAGNPPAKQPEISSASAPQDANPAAALLGSWHWPGLACGAGPQVSLVSDQLVFTMPGTPTYKHRIIRLDGASIVTEVEEPPEAKGSSYALMPKNGSLEVKTLPDGKTDVWDKCP